MLKSIELIGFKSFADKTRLEFVEGISALVGPNGSGKSNIVDAIKWVLGEQSVKKLRGNDMTDVIFGGSGTRQPMSLAEVSLTFDNSEKIFDVDAAEICITRRVYRSGEAEYLINKQPNKLKTLKEMLSGTGLGSQALSIIEQGRVQSLLESTPLQRRALFDEAAGVSRFHAKKIEALRRLERAEQNLSRLHDIVNEVESTLKNTKSQAGKAQQYRQYTERLQELRIQTSYFDWKKKFVQSEKIVAETDVLQTEETKLANLIDESEKRHSEHTQNAEHADTALRTSGTELAALKERIRGDESAIALRNTQIEEIEKEILHHGNQLIEINLQNSDAEKRRIQTDKDADAAINSHTEIQETHRITALETEKIAQSVSKYRETIRALSKQIENERQTNSRLSGEIEGIARRVESLEDTKNLCQDRKNEIETQIQAQEQLLSGIQAEGDTFSNITKQRQDQLDEIQRKKSQRSVELENRQFELSTLKQKSVGVTERISLLQDLLKGHDGVSPAVKEIMRQSQLVGSPFRFVHGLVADLFRVESEAAELVELALGPAAQLIVVSPEPELFKHIEHLQRTNALTARVGFIWLDPGAPLPNWMRNKGFEGRAGVLGRADRFVKVDSKYAHLASRLLARTWIVENLSIAKTLYKESDDRTHFLTRNGEYLASDGALVVGPMSASSGLITRRSELRTLLEQTSSFEGEIREKELNVELLRRRVAEDEERLEKAQQDLQLAVSQRNAFQLRLQSATERLGVLQKQLKNAADELTHLIAQHEQAVADQNAAISKQNLLNKSIAKIEEQLAEQKSQLESHEKVQKEQIQRNEASKIKLAKSEERIHFLQDRIKQLEDRVKERSKILHEHGKRHKMLAGRLESALLAVLQLESRLAESFVKKEMLNAVYQTEQQRKTDSVKLRNESQTGLKKTQQELTKLRSKIHAKQIESERLSQEQKSLVSRIKDEYSVDLSVENVLGDSEPADLETEIIELRAKIAKLGNVNLEAIETLEHLETRFTTYSNQYQDLISATKNIEEIIDQTNTETQNLFEDTFSNVQHHFRDLFQRFFGGGFADIVYDNPSNPLESGVDIVARPPGKELSSISLMSGGEKTLTCIALLLAFFKHRPNPVCILDEVDAALDEGNIDRFVNVIKDFRDSTQFLIVTHSKKTMACAGTIYGITMQDSGISKPISVRFEDVNEEGDIKNETQQPEPENDDVIFPIDSYRKNAA